MIRSIIPHAVDPKAEISCQLCLKPIDSAFLNTKNVLEVSDLLERKDVKKMERHTESDEAGWYTVLMGEQALRVMFYCPVCKTPRDLKMHEVAENGDVSPEVMCPCGGYHEEVRLFGWDPNLRKDKMDRFTKTYEG